VQEVESGRCKKSFTFPFLLSTLALVSLTENRELSVVRLALEPRRRIRPAKGRSMLLVGSMRFAMGSGLKVTANHLPHTKVSSMQFAVGSRFKVTANRPAFV